MLTLKSMQSCSWYVCSLHLFRLKFVPTTPQLGCGADISITSLRQVTVFQDKIKLTFVLHHNAVTSNECAERQCNASAV